MSERCLKVISAFLLAASISLIILPAVVRDYRSDPVFYGKDREIKIPFPEKSRGTISINEGDADELVRLYGIGETLADMIIAERESHGPFFYPEDLTSVKGIGMGKLSRFRDELDY